MKSSWSYDIGDFLADWSEVILKLALLVGGLWMYIKALRILHTLLKFYHVPDMAWDMVLMFIFSTCALSIITSRSKS